ncbi:MAG: protein-methionine-sulfoxide reductase heme-binding subunit MsrQ [Pseudomonadota bacterium]
MAAVSAVNTAARWLPKWPLYLVALVPVVWVFWAGATGALGVEPIKEIEHRLGLWGLQVLIASLCITPLRTHLGVNLIKFRRPLGLIAFLYILLHLLVWLILDVGIWTEIWKDIVKRPYITIGMAGFLLLLPLAVTSNDWSIRKLGAAGWRRLHKLAYPAVILGGAHYLMLVKGWQLEPILYMCAIATLLAMRLKWRKRQPAPGAA